MIRLVSTLALGAALGLASFSLPAAAQQRPAPAPLGPKLTKPFVDAYNVVNAALNMKDVAAAKAAYPKIMATSDEERHQLGILGVRLGQVSNDNSLISSAADLVINSAAAKPTEKAQFLYFKGSAQTDRHQGLLMMQQAYEQGFQPAGVEAAMAGAFYEAADLANGDIWVKRAADKEIAAGKSPAGFYAAALGEHAKAKDNAGTLEWSKQVASVSLVPQYWNIMIALAFPSISSGGTQARLDLLRLLRKVNALVSLNNYQDYIVTADPNRLPGEVLSVIADGKTAGILKGTEPFVVDFTNAANNRVGPDKASLATVDKDAAADATGKSAAGSADALVGYGDYAHAASLYQIALTKGGVDANRVNARMGIAKVGAGDLAGAEAAFKAVTAGPWKSVAEYWLIYLQAKAKNAPTTLPTAS